VAVRANCSLHRTLFDSTSVHAFLVRDEGLGTDAIGFHQEFLAVAAAARSRNVRVIDGRVGMASGEYRVGISVAVRAAGAWKSITRDLGVSALCVGIGCGGVAVDAEDFLRRRLVHEALDVFMAIDAGKLHRSMDRVLELRAINEERDLLAVDVLCQGCVAVATEAVFVFDLVLGANGDGRAQQKQCDRTEQNPAGNFHDYEETPEGESPAVTVVTSYSEMNHREEWIVAMHGDGT